MARNYTQSYYAYSKLRNTYGKQPLFQVVPAHMLDSILPDKIEQKKYILRNPVNRHVQATMPQSEHEANTKELVFHDQGMNHVEGGWPREVHLDNEEHVARHRRRIQHEDSYVHTVMNLTQPMTHCIDQNNAIDMYQTYFTDMETQTPVEKYQVRVANVFRDPLNRPVSCIVWTNEKKSKVAVSYCRKVYQPEKRTKQSTVCYLWDVNTQSEPIYRMKPYRACWHLACSPVDPEVLLAGLENGTINIFDTREGTALPVSNSSVYNSHREPITSLLYMHTRTNTEFFTGSTDGQCLWWDTRNLSKPVDQLSMSIRLAHGEKPDLSNSEPVSAMQYDRTLSTRFLCGSNTGLVINVNRMGRSHSEMLTSYWNAHSGPVRAVHRSNCTTRMFLTCGDWSVRVWSEEVRTAPIVVTKPYPAQVADAVWAPLRYSSYMAVCEDGVFYYWDLLRKYRNAVATLPVSKHELTKVTPHINGQLIATGDICGSLYLLQLSENMVMPGANDKSLMQKLYERETKREHILDMRMKEIRLKQMGESEAAAVTESDSLEVDEEETAAEEIYFKTVKEELRLMESSFASSKIKLF